MRHSCILIASVLALAACGGGEPEIITAEFDGRDCELYVVDETWLVYSWSPPVSTSRPLQLLARNLATGIETELEADWRGSGALDLDGGRVVYLRNAPGEGNLELVVRDLNSQSTLSMATGRLSEPRISGSNVAWTQYDEAGARRIALGSVHSGFQNTVAYADQPEHPTDNRPRISGNDVVFQRMEGTNRISSLYHHNIATGATQKLPIEAFQTNVYDLSDGRAVYRRTGEDVFYVMDLATQTERHLADVPRWIEGPTMRGNLVAWASHMPREDFKGVAGQPLMDERDYRTLHVMNIDSGKTITPIKDTFGMLRIRITEDRRIYAEIPRQPTAGPERITDIVRF